MSQKVIEMVLPAIDPDLWAEWKVASPISKMPNCDNCGHDELSLLHPDEAFCNRCCAIVRRKQ